MSRVISVFGSGEFLDWSIEVDRASLDAATNGDGSAVIVPMASAPEGDEVFNDWARQGLDHYKRMEVESRVSTVKTRADAEDPAHAELLEGASLIYFSGGNPAFLCESLRDTVYWAKVLELVDAGTAIAGCSAGACMMGESAPDSAADDAFTGGEVEIGDIFKQGLRLIPGVVFGPHWNMLKMWVPGLEDLIRQSVADDQLLVTLDDDTAILGDGNAFTVYGAGSVQLAPAGDTQSVHHAGDTFTIP